MRLQCTTLRHQLHRNPVDHPQALPPLVSPQVALWQPDPEVPDGQVMHSWVMKGSSPQSTGVQHTGGATLQPQPPLIAEEASQVIG